MREQRLLYLGARQMTAWRWQRGALSPEATFPPDEEGAQRFARYLAGNPKGVFSLLINVPDEEFCVETIPGLRGADRQAVIRRKLAQTFFGTPFCTAISLGREKNQRKEERLLLAALNNGAFFQPWLDGLRAANAMLSGIYSLPLLAPVLLRKLHLAHDPCLLLSVQDQSIRQSFFEKGALHFSRLTLLPSGAEGNPGEIAQAFAAEAAKLQQYLASQRLIGRGEALVAHILADPGAFDAIREHCIDTPDIRFHVLDVTECARRTGLKTEAPKSRAETLFLHLLAIDRPRIQFASEDLRHNFHLMQLRSMLWGASATMLAVCLAFSGNYLFDAQRISRDAEALRTEAASARQRYEDIIRTFPQVPGDTETLKRVIGRYLEEERRSATPVPLYQEVSRALHSEPDIEIERLDWRMGDTEEANADSESETLMVRGALRLPASTTNRQALAVFERFVTALRANTQLKVEAIQSPFGVASDRALRGGGPRGEEKPWAFIVLVTQKVKP